MKLKPFMSVHPLAQQAPTEAMREVHDAHVPAGLEYKASLVGMRAAYEYAVADVLAKLRPTIERAASSNDIERTLAVAELLNLSAPAPEPDAPATKAGTDGNQQGAICSKPSTTQNGAEK